MMKIVKIISHSLSTLSLIHLFPLSCSNYKRFLINSSILCHWFDINRNYLIWNISLIDGNKPSCWYLNFKFIVMVNEKRIWSLKIFSKTSYRIYNSHIVFHEFILSNQEFFSIKKLKVCSWSYERIHFSIFS